MATATDYLLVGAPAGSAPPVLDDVVLSWQPGAETAAVRLVARGGALGLPWFVHLGTTRLAELSEHAEITDEGVYRLRVRPGDSGSGS